MKIRSRLLPWVVGIGAWVFLGVLFFGYNAAQAAVNMTSNEAYGFQNVLETGDMLILIRYDLPVADWQKASTSTPYMLDATCDDITDIEDPCYTSLVSGTALQTLYDGPRGGGGVLLRGSRTLPRIANGLSGLYFAAGHGLTFGTATYDSCIEGSATLFAIVPTSCQAISWQASATIVANQALVKTILPQVMLNLQAAASAGVNTYVESDKITLTGMVFAREALAYINYAVPGAFIAAVGGVDFTFDPTASTSSLETSIQAVAETTDVYLGFLALSGQLFGMDVHVFGAFTTGILGIIIAVSLAGFAAPSLSIAATLLIAIAGVLMWVVPIQLVFVVIAALIVLGLMWFYRRVPT